MNTLEIPEKGIYIEYPSCMDELSPDQALMAAGLMFQVYAKQIEPEVFLKCIGDYLLNRKNNPDKPMAGAEAWDYWANESRVAETVEFFFKVEKGNTKEEEEVEEKVYVFEPEFTKQLVPLYELKGEKYYGCEDILNDITWNEFKDSMVAMQEFVAEGERGSLVELAAALYRMKIPKREISADWDGNERMEYSGSVKRYMIEKMDKAGDDFLFYVFMFFTGCINYLKNGELLIDGNMICFRPLFVGDGEKGSDDDHTGLSGVLFSLAESGVFGNAEETGKARFFDVLLRLFQIHIQTKKLKRKK